MMLQRRLLEPIRKPSPMHVVPARGRHFPQFLNRFLLTVTLLAFVGQAAMAREWTDATGKFKVEAELVKIEDGKVFLKKQSDGATIQVPIARLSAADQAHVQSLESPAPELTATDAATPLPLHTANCVGLMVVDPKPVFKHKALNEPPLSEILEKAVVQAGIDFRTLDRLTVLFFGPDTSNALGANKTDAVAVIEFSAAVEPASILAKIPTDYEATTVAGKACHKPAEKPNPWVCVIDERTLAFAEAEQSLVAALTATSDDAELAKLFATADKENEIRYALNMAPLKEALAQARATAAAVPQMAEMAKTLEVVEKMDSLVFTTDLDGPPSIEVAIQVGGGATPADFEEEIKGGLAKLPEMMKAAGAAAAGQAPQSGGAMQMNPAMMTQMLGGAAKDLDDKLEFKQAEDSLTISVKFPEDTPPLIETVVQRAGFFFAMMNQQSGSGGAFGAPPN